jgi:hypothetical protein
MRSNALLKADLVDEPAPPPVNIYWQYPLPPKQQRPAGPSSSPNALMPKVRQRSRQLAAQGNATERSKQFLERTLDRVLAEEKRIDAKRADLALAEKASSESMFEVPSRAMIPARYVNIASVAEATSEVVFVICCLSLVLWTITGFVLIHPFISIMAMIASIGFWFMAYISSTMKYKLARDSRK